MSTGSSKASKGRGTPRIAGHGQHGTYACFKFRYQALLTVASGRLAVQIHCGRAIPSRVDARQLLCQLPSRIVLMCARMYVLYARYLGHGTRVPELCYGNKIILGGW